MYLSKGLKLSSENDQLYISKALQRLSKNRDKRSLNEQLTSIMITTENKLYFSALILSWASYFKSIATYAFLVYVELK